MHCVSVSLVVLAVYTCIIQYLSVIALIWYTPYACVQCLELLVLLNSQSIHQYEYFFSDLILNVYIMYDV